jgi:hypothetical protein
MGHHGNWNAMEKSKSLAEINYMPAGWIVERGGQLISKDKLKVSRQCPRDCRLLLFAAGKGLFVTLCGVLVGP